MSSITAILSVRHHTRTRVAARILLLLWCVCLFVPALSHATRRVEEQAVPRAANPGEVFLDRWQAAEAEQWARQQLARDPHNAFVHFLLGQAQFYLGQYHEALASFDTPLSQMQHSPAQSYRDFIAATIQSTAALQLVETEHFRIYLDPERDAALVPYVGEVLEKSYQRLGTIFGLFPSHKIRVEIFPTPDTFYPASSLSERDIEVSGAIGICKFNKIMLLSPRNLARGYRWTDALSHEYIHYLLVHLSGNKAPIWLHEGIARYFEDAWRLPRPAWLSRRTESLLAHALAHNSFVGFTNMEPSLVKLDTTYQVQLGYAEAASAIDFIVQRLDTKGLVRILQDLQQSHDEGATGAIARVMGYTFEQFEAEWRQFLTSKNLREHQGVRLPRFALKTEGDTSRENLEEEIQSVTARMHTRLGDRLRQRGRARAAISEYRRALRQDPYSPYLLNKLASTLLGQKRWQDALSPLQRARELAPDYGTTYSHLGRAYVALAEYAHARQALREAIQINPFNPFVHLHLAESYRRLGQAEQAEQEHHLFKKLQEMP